MQLSPRIRTCTTRGGLGDSSYAVYLDPNSFAPVFAVELTMDDFDHHGSSAAELGDRPGSWVVLPRTLAYSPEFDVAVLAPIEAAIIIDVDDDLLRDDDFVAAHILLHFVVLNDEGDGELRHDAGRSRPVALLVFEGDLLERFGGKVVDGSRILSFGDQEVFGFERLVYRLLHKRVCVEHLLTFALMPQETLAHSASASPMVELRVGYSPSEVVA